MTINKQSLSLEEVPIEFIRAWAESGIVPVAIYVNQMQSRKRKQCDDR